MDIVSLSDNSTQTGRVTCVYKNGVVDFSMLIGTMKIESCLSDDNLDKVQDQIMLLYNFLKNVELDFSNTSLEIPSRYNKKQYIDRLNTLREQLSGKNVSEQKMRIIAFWVRMNVKIPNVFEVKKSYSGDSGENHQLDIATRSLEGNGYLLCSETSLLVSRLACKNGISTTIEQIGYLNHHSRVISNIGIIDSSWCLAKAKSFGFYLPTDELPDERDNYGINYIALKKLIPRFSRMDTTNIVDQVSSKISLHC